MKKTLLIIILILLLAGAGWYLFGRKKTISTEDNNETDIEETDTGSSATGNETKPVDDTAMIHDRLQGATIQVPDIDTEAVLVKGEATFDAGAGVDGDLLLGDTQKIITVGNQRYVLVDASMSTGGSGTFDYIFAFRIEEGSLVQTGAVYLGDRVIVKSIDATSKGTGADVVVTILTRADGEPLSAEPTVSDTLNFTMEADGSLIE